MRIETRLIGDLQAAPYNPRKISDDALKGLKASIRRFGIVEPIIINERTGNIVGGHQRLRALMEMGESKTDVIIVDLPESEERVLNITLNNPHIAGEFTDDLQIILEDIKIELPDAYVDLMLDELETNAKSLDAGAQMDGIEYRIIISCDNETHQLDLLQRFETEGLKCQLLMS